MQALIYGQGGTGKTFSLGTIVEAGYRLVVVSLDPNFKDGLTNWAKLKKKTPADLADKIHVVTIQPDLDDMKHIAKLAAAHKHLQAKEVLETADPNKIKAARHLVNFMSVFDNLVTDRGVELGSVFNFDTKTVLVIDNLSRYTEIVELYVRGYRGGLSQTERANVQHWIQHLLKAMTSMPCHKVLLAHADLLRNEVGVDIISPRSSGYALQPVIPTYFTDVLYAERSEDSYRWVVSRKGVSTRLKNGTMAKDMAQDFGLLLPNLLRPEKEIDFGF